MQYARANTCSCTYHDAKDVRKYKNSFFKTLDEHKRRFTHLNKNTTSRSSFTGCQHTTKELPSATAYTSTRSLTSVRSGDISRTNPKYNKACVQYAYVRFRRLIPNVDARERHLFVARMWHWSRGSETAPPDTTFWGILDEQKTVFVKVFRNKIRCLLHLCNCIAPCFWSENN